MLLSGFPNLWEAHLPPERFQYFMKKGFQAKCDICVFLDICDNTTLL